MQRVRASLLLTHLKINHGIVYFLLDIIFGGAILSIDVNNNEEEHKVKIITEFEGLEMLHFPEKRLYAISRGISKYADYSEMLNKHPVSIVFVSTDSIEAAMHEFNFYCRY